MSPAVRWIVFDAVGTLLVPQPSVAEVYHTIGRKFGSKLTLDETAQRFRQAFRDSEHGPPDARLSLDASPALTTSEPQERQRWQQIVASVLSDVTDPQLCFQELWDHFANPSSWTMFADVPRCFQQLQQRGLRIAIASNFDQRLHRLSAELSAFRAVEVCLVSSELGWRKPAGEFYAAVERSCGAGSDELLMVGDNWHADVAAPRAQGWSAVWLNRRQDLLLADAVQASPRDQISSLDLLPEWIDSRHGAPTSTARNGHS